MSQVHCISYGFRWICHVLLSHLRMQELKILRPMTASSRLQPVTVQPASGQIPSSASAAHVASSALDAAPASHSARDPAAAAMPQPSQVIHEAQPLSPALHIHCLLPQFTLQSI